MKKQVNQIGMILNILRLVVGTLAFGWVFIQLITGGRLVVFTNLDDVSHAFDILVLLWLLTVTRR